MGLDGIPKTNALVPIYILAGMSSEFAFNGIEGFHKYERKYTENVAYCVIYSQSLTMYACVCVCVCECLEFLIYLSNACNG